MRAIDQALGIGGYPRRHLTVLYGKEQSGKTTLCHAFSASVLKSGGIVLFIDMEKKGSADWIRKNIATLGVEDLDNLYITQPKLGTEAIDIMVGMADVVDAIILDSVFHLVTPDELDSDAGDSHPAALARLLSQESKKMTSAFSQSNTVALFTNQVRYKFVSNRWEDPITFPGGKALEYMSTIMVYTTRLKMLREKKGEDPYGIACRANVKKNQTAAPHRKADYVINFDSGIDRIGDTLETAVLTRVVDRRGAFYFLDEERLGQGRENTIAAINSRPEIIEEIERRLEDQTTAQP